MFSNIDEKETLAIQLANEYQGAYTSRRIVEELNTPLKNYSLSALKKLHARIFKDFPNAWFNEDASIFFEHLPSNYLEFYPGKFREANSNFNPWIKIRPYKNTDIYTFYSCADKHDEDKNIKYLDSINLDILKNSDLETKINKVVEVYHELDFFHPFEDGNSRTIRVFTAHLAKAIGLQLDWSKVDYENLYAARDLNLLKKSEKYYENNDEVMMHIEEGLRVLKERDSLNLKELLLSKNAIIKFSETVKEIEEKKHQHHELSSTSLEFE